MLTGRQIREARLMLGWGCATLSMRSNVNEDIIERAEIADSLPRIMLHQAARIQQAFERAGVRFGRNRAVMRVSSPDD